MFARRSTSLLAVIAFGVSSCIDFTSDAALRERRRERCATLRVTCDDAGYPFDGGACGSSCLGCCDRGLCVDGALDWACGTAGAACTDCRPMNQVCSGTGLGGRCVPSVAGGGSAGGGSAGGSVGGGSGGGDAGGPVAGGSVGGGSGGGSVAGGSGGGSFAGGSGGGSFAGGSGGGDAGGASGGGTAPGGGGSGGGVAGGRPGCGFGGGAADGGTGTLPNFSVVRVLGSSFSLMAQAHLDVHDADGGLVRTTPLGSAATPFSFRRLGGLDPEGALTRSTDGRFLVVAGYTVDAGTPENSSAGTLPFQRVIARVDSTGMAERTITSAFAGTTLTSVASIDGTRYWLGGGASNADGGVQTVAHNAGVQPASFIFESPRQIRATVISDGLLYVSTGSSPNGGSSRVFSLGAPGTTSSSATFLPGVDLADPGNFVFLDVDGIATLYVADRDTSGQGIRKYTRTADAGLWTQTGSFLPGALDGGAQRSCLFVAAQKVASDVIVLCVAGEVFTTFVPNRVIRFIDPGGCGGNHDAGVTVLTAPDGGRYLGVAF